MGCKSSKDVEMFPNQTNSISVTATVPASSTVITHPENNNLFTVTNQMKIPESALSKSHFIEDKPMNESNHQDMEFYDLYKSTIK